jgi:exopolyphosphatase / guanosine-5'-triphosphate,3'-diphosphate pyrophosphatase
MRVAAIDCGTNSIRLLVADATEGADGTDRTDGTDGSGSLRDVAREMRIVRLGQDVDRTGVLAPEAIERTRLALGDYAATVRSLAAQRVRMVATSAVRDAANREEFAAMVRATLGADVEVISGAEEAELSFVGAVGGLGVVSPPVLVADIGGGSTELVVGSGPTDLRAGSMDVGAVRMTERHLHADPPTTEQVAAAQADISAALDRAALEVPLTTAHTFVGVAGTITTVAALALGLNRYDSERIHGTVLRADQIEQVAGELLTMTHEQRAAHAVIHPGRVDVIAAGALILQSVLRRVGMASLTVSERDILDGIARSIAS